ncbi:hypothetical protein [Pectinatus frisingensis]|uniref:hypothetical protein n=1 Tax=Pectinatus frisingensis TaxID=865 RepID=UPI0018C73AB3|nr:hypothetical protein [Pectinatus frisingensis]
MNRCSKEEFWKKIACMLAFVVAGCACLVITTCFEQNNVFYKFFQTMATAFLVSAPLSIILSIQSDNSISRIFDNVFPINKKCAQYGLVDIREHFPLNDKEIKTEFIHSKKFYLVMNDGKSFISGNNALFNERLSQELHETNVILLNYNNTALMTLLSKRNHHEESYYPAKIKEVISYHIDEWLRKDYKVKLYLNDDYNTMSILLLDGFAIISLYREAAGIDEVPHLVFKKEGTEYDKIYNDVMKLCKKSEKYNND